MILFQRENDKKNENDILIFCCFLQKAKVIILKISYKKGKLSDFTEIFHQKQISHQITYFRQSQIVNSKQNISFSI